MTNLLTSQNHADLFDLTHKFQLKLLERGNDITRDHRLALRRIAIALVDLAWGNEEGR